MPSLTTAQLEIRTPLHILCAMADELQSATTTAAAADTSTAGDPNVLSDLALLKSSSHWLLSQANCVLDVCALELNAVRVECSPVSTRGYVSADCFRFICQSVSAAADFPLQCSCFFFVIMSQSSSVTLATCGVLCYLPARPERVLNVVVCHTGWCSPSPLLQKPPPVSVT